LMPLRGGVNGSGYIQIQTGSAHPAAHRLVWESVHGPIPPKMEINHINGVKTDNRIANLELVTHQENIQHAYDTGLKSNAGEKHPGAKLTDAAVRLIRERYVARKVTAQMIADEIGVGRKCVSDVVAGRTWTGVV
jgi:hypothetical protein